MAFKTSDYLPPDTKGRKGSEYIREIVEAVNNIDEKYLIIDVGELKEELGTLDNRHIKRRFERVGLSTHFRGTDVYISKEDNNE